MKLTYLAASTLPSSGADAVHVMNVCKAFALEGVEVTLIARKSNSSEDVFDYYGVERDLFEIHLVQRPNLRFIGGFIFGYNMAKIYKQLPKPDVIYARSMHALRRVNPKTIPFFFESHWKPQNRIYSNWQKRWLNQKNLIKFIFISKGLEAIYTKTFPTKVEKFKVLHDACNIPNLRSTLPNNKRLQVGYVGSFFKGNGYGLIPLMAKQLSDVDFHIVGGKEPELSQLKEIYTLNNLTFYGHVAHKELSHMYLKMDVMLAPYQDDVPSLDWMSPMKLFEYMSYGKAMVVSNYPVIREVLNDSNSILVKSDDLNAWIDALKLLKNNAVRQQMGSNAYAHFIENYTWSSRVKEIIKLATQFNESK